MGNCYSVFVRTGREAAVRDTCSRQISRELIKEVFIPHYERMRRYGGKWHREQHPLFPGYLFLITDQVETVFQELKSVPELTKILGAGTDFIPLHPEEVEFLKQIGNENHVTEMSTGFIVGDKVTVTSGPMKNIEGSIKKIDRHKRIAVVTIPMFGREQDVTMGLEIVEKIGVVQDNGNIGR